LAKRSDRVGLGPSVGLGLGLYAGPSGTRLQTERFDCAIVRNKSATENAAVQDEKNQIMATNVWLEQVVKRCFLILGYKPRDSVLEYNGIRCVHVYSVSQKSITCYHFHIHVQVLKIIVEKCY